MAAPSTAASHFGSAMLQYSRTGGLNHTKTTFTGAACSFRIPRGAKQDATYQRRNFASGDAPHRRPKLALPKIPTGPVPQTPIVGQRRAFATPSEQPIQDQDQTYEAVVVGAGPAGITCMGNLLERNLGPILWVDDNAFSGGRVHRIYREVPSNTKVKTFTDFALGVEPFRRIVEAGNHGNGRRDSVMDGSLPEGKEDRLSAMRGLDQEKGCRLSHAADMCLMLTEGLKQTAGVTAREAKVTEAIFNESSSDWNLRLQSAFTTSEVRTKRLVFCTGSSPNNDPLPVSIPGPSPQTLDLDTALSPTRLSAALPHHNNTSQPLIISVIGASHSAILVLMNLYTLASTSHPNLRVRWLTRHPLRYAVFMDGWILRDNTGLKGEAAEWAKANLEPETYSRSPVNEVIERVDYEAGREKDVFRERIPGSAFYVQAIGYNRDPIPTVKLAASEEEVQPQFDHERGTFHYVNESVKGEPQRLEQLPGLFGAGIAWPERVKDPHGNVEMAVGFWKFMKFVKRVSPEWN